jgi:hypothetical protein
MIIWSTRPGSNYSEASLPPPHVGKVSEALEVTPTYRSCLARACTGLHWDAPSTAPRPYTAPLQGRVRGWPRSPDLRRAQDRWPPQSDLPADGRCAGAQGTSAPAGIIFACAGAPGPPTTHDLAGVKVGLSDKRVEGGIHIRVFYSDPCPLGHDVLRESARPCLAARRLSTSEILDLYRIESDSSQPIYTYFRVKTFYSRLRFAVIA